MENLKYYEAFRSVPENAKKTIAAGRTKGFTDINPMWRIKKLTEVFGMCGFGWYYEITDKRLEYNTEQPTGEVSAFVDINLYVKVGNEWSKPIVGTGGSSFVSKERNGLYQSDECYKMALTDAISVACKALGIGADVYWDDNSTKYSKKTEEPKRPEPWHDPRQTEDAERDVLMAQLITKCTATEVNPQAVASYYHAQDIKSLETKWIRNALKNWDALMEKVRS